MYGGQTVNLFFRTTASVVSLLRSGKLWFLMRYTVAVLVLFLVSAFGARLCATALFGSWSPRSRTGSGCLWGLAREQFHGARFCRRSWEGNALFRWSSAPSTGHGERTLGEIILLVSSSTHATLQRRIASSTPFKRFPRSVRRLFTLTFLSLPQDVLQDISRGTVEVWLSRDLHRHEQRIDGQIRRGTHSGRDQRKGTGKKFTSFCATLLVDVSWKFLLTTGDRSHSSATRRGIC